MTGAGWTADELERIGTAEELQHAGPLDQRLLDDTLLDDTLPAASGNP